MQKQMKTLALSLVVIAVSAMAQTNVTTTGGTANTLPVFTGSATVGNSIISQSNGKVGINTSNPAQSLDIVGILHVSGAANPTTSIQGAYLGWNASGGTGETNFINNQGLGPGGFAFMNTPSSGTPMSTLMFIEGAGNVGIGTTSPGARLEVNGNIQISSGSGG
jgi:hypothetical protein